MKIATHDSGTGEKSKNFLHRLFEPFAKTQTKTIQEQWDLGVRYFDLRIDSKYQIAHGIWKADKNLWEILDLLNSIAANDKHNKTYYYITIEGNYKNTNELIEKVAAKKDRYSNIICTKINKKRPIWTCVYSYVKLPCASDYVSVPTPEEYMKFDFKNWKKYIPIPKILNKLYKRKYEFNKKMFTMVDFI